MTDPKEVERNRARYNAEQLRYKKPIVRDLNASAMLDQARCIMEECYEIHWYTDSEDGEDSLLNAMDGDEEAAWEFRMAFGDLEANVEQLVNDLEEYWDVLPDGFDTFFAAIGAEKSDFGGGMLGYDSFEDDYCGLQDAFTVSLAERCASEKILRKTKKEILELAGTCFGVAMNFISVRDRYENLKAAIDILRGKNTALLQQVKEIEQLYEDAAAEKFDPWNDATKKFDKLLEGLPDLAWIE